MTGEEGVSSEKMAGRESVADGRKKMVGVGGRGSVH